MRVESNAFTAWLAVLSVACGTLRATALELPRVRIDPGEISVGAQLDGNAFILSPDGRWLGFHSSRGRGYIDFTTGKVTALPDGGRLYAQFVSFNTPTAWWSPQGDSVAWYVWREGKQVLRTWPVGTALDETHGKELLVLPRKLYQPNKPLVWSPDGKTLYLIVNQQFRQEKALAKDDNPPTKSANVTLSLSGSYASDEDEGFHGFDKLYPEAYADAVRSVILAADVATGRVGLLARGNDIDRLYLSPDGRRLVAVQSKRKKSRRSKDSQEEFLQGHADVYMTNTAAVDTLPAIDLEHMEDRTAGWFDHRGQRMMPVLTNVETNSTGGFSPGSDFPKATGTNGNPTIIWASDNTAFVYATVGRYATGDIYLYDLATRQTRNLTESVPPLKISSKQQGYFENQRQVWNSPKFGSIFNPLWLPDSKHLIVKARGDVWVVPLNPEEVARNLTETFNQEIIRILPAPDQFRAAVDAGGRVTVLTRDRLSRYDTVWKLDPGTGALTKVADTGVCTNLTVATDPRSQYLVYTGQSATSLTNIYRLKLDGAAQNGNKPEDVTKYKLELNDRLYPESRVLSWNTADGYPGYGILYLPEGASSTKKEPLILNAYPSQSVSQPDLRAYAGARFYDESLDGLLQEGIAVLYADIPMSDQGVYEHPMMQVVNAVNTAVDAALATGLIDEKRMAIMGTSYGGYMVDAVLTQTNRFKTGVSIAGPADITAFYLGNSSVESLDSIQAWTSWTEYRQARIGKKYWEAPERYTENSPLSHWDKVNAPMLVIQGGQDTTTHPFFGEEAYKGLKYQNKSAIFAYYPRDTHAIGGDPDATRRIRGWLREHLVGKPPITQIADQGSYFMGDNGKADSSDRAPPATPAPSN